MPSSTSDRINRFGTGARLLSALVVAALLVIVAFAAGTQFSGAESEAQIAPVESVGDADSAASDGAVIPVPSDDAGAAADDPSDRDAEGAEADVEVPSVEDLLNGEADIEDLLGDDFNLDDLLADGFDPQDLLGEDFLSEDFDPEAFAEDFFGEDFDPETFAEDFFGEDFDPEAFTQDLDLENFNIEEFLGGDGQLNELLENFNFEDFNFEDFDFEQFLNPEGLESSVNGLAGEPLTS